MFACGDVFAILCILLPISARRSDHVGKRRKRKKRQQVIHPPMEQVPFIEQVRNTFIPLNLNWLATTIALVVSNLLPLFGVLFFGWNLFELVFLYWVENIIIGAFNVVRMITVAVANRQERGCGTLMSIPFFIFHYGAFCAGHGVILWELFGPGLLGNSSITGGFVGLFGQALSRETVTGLGVAATSIAISHGIAYVTKFLCTGEYRQVTMEDTMLSPYDGIFRLHIAIIIGGVIVSILQQPAAAIVLLVLIKFYIDLKLHWRERRVMAAKGAVNNALELQ